MVFPKFNPERSGAMMLEDAHARKGRFKLANLEIAKDSAESEALGDLLAAEGVWGIADPDDYATAFAQSMGLAED